MKQFKESIPVLTCMNCHHKFAINGGFINKDVPARCPYCGNKINKDMYNDLVQAIQSVREFNMTSKKYHDEANENQFRLDMITANSLAHHDNN